MWEWEWRLPLFSVGLGLNWRNLINKLESLCWQCQVLFVCLCCLMQSLTCADERPRTHMYLQDIHAYAGQIIPFIIDGA